MKNTQLASSTATLLDHLAAEALFKSTAFDTENLLPDEIKLHILRYLEEENLVKMAKVSHKWNKLTQDDSLWQKNSLYLAKEDDHRAYKLQYVYKDGLVKQKAKLLAKIFEKGPKQYTGEYVSSGFEGEFQIFRNFAMPEVEEVFNNKMLNPLAIIYYAQKYYGWTRQSVHQKDKSQSTLFDVLVESTLSDILQLYLKHYGKEIDINKPYVASNGSSSVEISSLLHAALNDHNAIEKLLPENAIILLQHGYELTGQVSEIFEEVNENREEGFPPIIVNANWQTLFCLMLEKGLNLEVFKAAFLVEYGKNQKMYEAAARKYQASALASALASAPVPVPTVTPTI